MPIYEYQCSACSHQLEVIQKFSDAPLTECPACGKLTLQKMISAPAFQLKGSGWYQTDFKGIGRKKPSVGSETAKDAAPDDAQGCASVAGGRTPGATKPATEGKAAGETKTEAAPAPGADTSAKPKPAASDAA